jgi:putative endonuclease
MKEHVYFVYILASHRNGTLYTGVTNDVLRRTWQHRNGLAEGFTKKYGVHILVWHQLHTDSRSHCAREADQGLEPRLESPPDRETQFRLERFVRTPPRQHRVAGDS